LVVKIIFSGPPFGGDVRRGGGGSRSEKAFVGGLNASEVWKKKEKKGPSNLICEGRRVGESEKPLSDYTKLVKGRGHPRTFRGKCFRSKKGRRESSREEGRIGRR